MVPLTDLTSDLAMTDLSWSSDTSPPRNRALGNDRQDILRSGKLGLRAGPDYFHIIADRLFGI